MITVQIVVLVVLPAARLPLSAGKSYVIEGYMSSSSLVLAQVGDVQRLIPMVRAYHELEELSFDEVPMTKALRCLLSNPSLGSAWFIHEGLLVVGYIVLCFGFSLEFMGKDAFVDEFYVLEEHRGRGVGRASLKLVVEEARKFGVSAVHLEVDSANLPAKWLYSSLDFKDRGRFQLMSRHLV